MTSTLKCLTTAVLVSLTAFGGLSVSADAAVKKRVKVVIKTHVTRVVPRRAVVVVPGGTGCGYYYDKWQLTGRPYWKGRYDACIYG